MEEIIVVNTWLDWKKPWRQGILKIQTPSLEKADLG
jgi:hypothetical protein